MPLDDPSHSRPAPPRPVNGEEVLAVKSLTVAYGERVVLDSVDLRACAGEVVAVMGP